MSTDPFEPVTPDWASFFTVERFEAFIGVVEAELKGRGLDYSYEDGIVRLRLPGESKPRTLGLQNLAQMCHMSEVEEWAAAVRGHFDAAFTVNELTGDLERLSGDFEAARAVLKVRLYPEEYAQNKAGEQSIHGPFAHGIVWVLVFDLPTVVSTVNVDAVQRWGQTPETLLDIALHNVRDEQPAPGRERTDLDNGGRVHALLGDSFFTASHAMLLDDYVQSPHGAIVGIPHRHAVLYHPIEDMRIVPSLNGMIPAVAGMYTEGPGSVSPNLYWWHGGQMTLLPTRVTDTELHFAPPPEFVDLLNRLATGDGGGEPG